MAQGPDEPRDNRPIAWMARNAIAANLIMIILIGGGLWAALNIQKEVFPQFQLDVVEVSVGYPGAPPSEVETGILQPIEEAVRGLDGIREITAQAEEGQGSVTIELIAGADRMKAFQDIDQAIASIRTFPEEIEEPEVRLQSRQRVAMQVALFGAVDAWTLRKLGERLRDRLLSDPEITRAELDFVPDYVTHVEIPARKLREFDLTLPEIAETIQQSSENVPAGSVRASQGEVLLRLEERKVRAEQFGDIAVLADPSGATVTLSDLADIEDGFEEGNFHSQFNGQPSLEIQVYRTGEQSPLEIEDGVKQILSDFESVLPPGVQWRIDSNNAQDYRERLNLLIENGILSIFIVLGILSLFLQLRLAFWVMAGMAISFIGSLLFLPPIGVTINMISMFGFLVAIGLVVDDAIVVGENIYTHRQTEKTRLTASIRGARGMAAPVTFAILTNIVAFVPLLFIPGETGKFWWPLPVVVIAVLLLSLFEALFVLPAHLAHTRGDAPRAWLLKQLKRGQEAFARAFDRFVETRYKAFLELCMRNRYLTITAALALLAVAGAYARSDHMGMILMPELSADEIEAGISLPVGTTPEQAGAMAMKLTRATRRMYEANDLGAVAEGIKTNVRGQSFLDIEIVMRPPDQRDMTAQEVIRLWRNEIGEIAGVDQITFEAERGPAGFRPDISVDLSHTDVATLEKASQDLRRRLESFANTVNISDNYEKGKTRLDYRLLPEGRALGVTAEEVGEQLRGAFFGNLALRQLRGTNETEVRVKLPESQRKDLQTLEDFVVRTGGGTEIPLSEITEVTYTEAFSTINRRNGRRVVTVSTDVEPKRQIGRVITALRQEVLPSMQAQYPGLTWSFQGSQAEMRESTQALWGSFALAALVIYALLAVAFRSYAQPVIVMAAIPFGVIGAVFGHLLMGYSLSLVSLMGVVALAGVVVNASLIMTDYANRQRASHGLYEAVRMAGLRRFRPIVLTTLTTFGGLSPILFETSMQAQNLIPMAISLGFGIVVATAIIVVLVPCLYLALEDIKARLGPRRAENEAT